MGVPLAVPCPLPLFEAGDGCLQGRLFSLQKFVFKVFKATTLAGTQMDLTTHFFNGFSHSWGLMIIGKIGDLDGFIAIIAVLVQISSKIDSRRCDSGYQPSGKVERFAADSYGCWLFD